jgi:mannose-1-phosphate guanylyltransferase/mannose-6-phosphate isomerase
MAAIFPIILSGGSGTRLWPLSRALYPKQFIRFFNGKGETLLGDTLKRLNPADGFAPPIILCNNDHRFLVKEETSRAGIEPKGIILEPVARNTAPAIAVAALAACRDDENAILAVMPSDHVVKNEANFVAAVRRAAEVAATGKLVLFGIVPTEPHTGYGYIRQGAPLEGIPGAYAVDAFFEKPDLATAQSYLARGGHFWNSGIFVLHARTFLDELRLFEPRILEAARSALDQASADLGFLRLDHAAFASAPNISIDYAVMEKTRAAAMLPIDVGWNDVGSWSSLWEIAPQDDGGNAVRGDAILEDTSGCYVHSEKSLVATIGIKDLVIVNTPDALLVADKARAQDVSKIVARLKQSGRHEHQRPLRSYRPWGFYETLSLGPRFEVKLAHLKPGASLSLETRDRSSQHWIVMQGTAKVTIEGVEKLVSEGESVRIDAARPHRLENPGTTPLELIEVQVGTSLSKD